MHYLYSTWITGQMNIYIQHSFITDYLFVRYSFTHCKVMVKYIKALKVLYARSQREFGSN